jgi:hypothetical protein
MVLVSFPRPFVRSVVVVSLCALFAWLGGGDRQAVSAPPDPPAANGLDTLPPLNGVIQSWIGNTFFARSTSYSAVSAQVPWLIDDMAVSPDGRVATQSHYNEAGSTYNVFQDGKVIGNVNGMNGHPSSGRAVAFDGRYMYLAVDGNGIRRMNQDGSQAERDLPGGFPSSEMNRWAATVRGQVSSAESYAGLAVGGGLLFASDVSGTLDYTKVNSRGLKPKDPKFSGIRVFDTGTLAVVRTLPLLRPGHLAATLDGAAVWAIQNAGGEGSGPRVVKLDARTGDILATVTDVARPRDIAVDARGRLMVAAGRPQRQVRVYAADGKFLRAFGASGGLFGGPAQERGRYRPGVLNDPSGVGVDAKGNLYVVSVGSVWPVHNEIQRFDALPDGAGWKATPAWHVEGMMIEDYAVPDPTDENSFYSTNQHFQMDWSRGPGKEWRVVGETLDSDHYPEDPRIFAGTGTSALGVFVLHGRKFLVLSGSRFFRLDPRVNGEVAIPSLYINVRPPHMDAVSCYDPSAADMEPVPCTSSGKKVAQWPPHYPVQDGGFIWRDADGNGRIGKDEYDKTRLVPPGYGMFSHLMLDPQGNLWSVLVRDGTTDFRLARYPLAESLDKAGNPVYRIDKVQMYPVPGGLYPEQFRFSDSGDLYTLGYDAKEFNAMRAGKSKADLRVEKWTGWLADPFRSKKAWALPGVARTTRWLQSTNTANDDVCTLRPAGDYLFLGGCWHARVGVYRADNGKPVGLMRTPGFLELLDIQDIKAVRRKNGEYIVLYSGYVNNTNVMYRWMPEAH